MFLTLVKQRVPFSHVGTLILVILALLIGIRIGIYFGGARALWRLGQFEYGERRRRAGL